MKSLGRRKDGLSYLFNGTDPGTGTVSTPTDIIDEANVLPIAAGDAMDTALYRILFYLSQNLHTYDKLAAEVHNFSLTSRDLSGRNIAFLHLPKRVHRGGTATG